MDLAIKYRPDDLNKLLGNQTTIDILNKYIEEETHPHSYLFCGERGLGKTTIARILSDEFNCDLIEMNSSDDRGIDSIRNNIIGNSKVGTFSGKNKAYLLDECHQLPNLSQDALLKIIEEPPKNVYFFLCTTEPNKLNDTIKSRCQPFQLEKIGVRTLYPYLIEISKKEENEISKKVARRIAETSEGHVRDALKILQKVLQIDSEEKQLKLAGEKIESQAEIIELCRTLLNGGWNDCRDILNKLQNENPESIRKVILGYMKKVILSDNLKSNQAAAIIIECLEDFAYDYAVLCKNIFAFFTR